MPSEEDAITGRLLILEYEQVKEEQRSRIGFRDNLLYATLATMAAIITFTLQNEGRLELLLLLPPATTLLGWTYLVNDQKISAIGQYIREELEPRLAMLLSVRAPLFGWETAHRSDRHRVSRKRLQLGFDVLLFCGGPAIALIVYWAKGPFNAALLSASLAELVLIFLLAVQIFRYADLRRW